MTQDNSDFAKIFRDEAGRQILVTRDAGDAGEPAVKVSIEPEGFGVCYMALRYDDDDNGWDTRDEVFAAFTEEEARVCASGLVRQLEELSS